MEIKVSSDFEMRLVELFHMKFFIYSFMQIQNSINLPLEKLSWMASMKHILSEYFKVFLSSLIGSYKYI